MKKYLPIVLVAMLLAGGFYFINKSQNEPKDENKTQNIENKSQTFTLSDFSKPVNCAKLPKFLYKAGFNRAIIDLSQLKYKGIAFYQGNRVMHKKSWEVYDYFGTYTIDTNGNLFIAPMPFISIKPATFNLQKNIYKQDSISSNLDIFMKLDDITPDANNPYGVLSLQYDCSDNTLWVGAIDKTNYKGVKGRIYHIDIKNKKVIDKIEKFDALTLAFLKSNNKNYLLAGSAYDNGVYIIEKKKPIKLFELPNTQLRVRKIKPIAKNTLKLEAIKFTYSLIAQSTNKQRVDYKATYNPKAKSWSLEEIK